MSNIVKLREDISSASNSSGAALDAGDEKKVRALELFAATKEEVGRAIGSIDVVVQHSRLTITRVCDADIREVLERELTLIEQSLEVARKAFLSLERPTAKLLPSATFIRSQKCERTFLLPTPSITLAMTR